MKYIVHYVLNDDTVVDWTEHKSLSSALDQIYYWLHNSRVDRCKVYKVDSDYIHIEIAEIYNI